MQFVGLYCLIKLKPLDFRIWEVAIRMLSQYSDIYRDELKKSTKNVVECRLHPAGVGTGGFKMQSQKFKPPYFHRHLLVRLTFLYWLSPTGFMNEQRLLSVTFFTLHFNLCFHNQPLEVITLSLLPESSSSSSSSSSSACFVSAANFLWKRYRPVFT